jgi:glycosidase
MINNHDENAWAGTVKEQYGAGEKAMAVFSYIGYGVPVLYTGQEVGLDKRLRFFEKDTVNMDDPEQLFPFYKKLNQIKADNPALWSGSYSAMPIKLEDGNKDVFSIKRTQRDNVVIAIINMSAKEQNVKYNAAAEAGRYTDAFTGNDFQIGEMKLSPWQYIVVTNKK